MSVMFNDILSSASSHAPTVFRLFWIVFAIIACKYVCKQTVGLLVTS